MLPLAAQEVDTTAEVSAVPEVEAAPVAEEAPLADEAPLAEEAPVTGDTVNVMGKVEVIETPESTRVTLGENEVVIVEENGSIIHPQILPDETSVLFTNVTDDPRMVTVQSLETEERKELFEGHDAKYLPTGHLVYELDNSIFVVPFDLDRLELSGGSIPMIQGVSRPDGAAGGPGGMGEQDSDRDRDDRLLPGGTTGPDALGHRELLHPAGRHGLARLQPRGAGTRGQADLHLGLVCRQAGRRRGPSPQHFRPVAAYRERGRHGSAAPGQGDLLRL